MTNFGKEKRIQRKMRMNKRTNDGKENEREKEYVEKLLFYLANIMYAS